MIVIKQSDMKGVEPPTPSVTIYGGLVYLTCTPKVVSWISGRHIDAQYYRMVNSQRCKITREEFIQEWTTRH